MGVRYDKQYTSNAMSDTYETASDIEARLNRLCGDAAGDIVGDTEELPTDVSDCGDGESMMADPAVSQHIIRAQRTESSVVTDTLTGSFRCQFEPTQTLFVLHVPIYPPMKSVPQVETICDQDNVVARTTLAKKFGLRIELKRASSSSQSESVIAEVTASSS